MDVHDGRYRKRKGGVYSEYDVIWKLDRAVSGCTRECAAAVNDLKFNFFWINAEADGTGFVNGANDDVVAGVT